MSTPKLTPNQLQTIDPQALAQVSGGATTTTQTQGDQVLTALTGILDSIHSLATRNNSGFNQQEMFMLMMIMQQRNQQQAAVAQTSAWPWPQEPIIRYY
ncbi:MAG TPA: hypothetical protein VHN14_35965 [Kofleriaceae bacterium]|jgi:hypothetical protein|nr:hypothetical protein [Kofleriaceae bacterium]